MKSFHHAVVVHYILAFLLALHLVVSRPTSYDIPRVQGLISEERTLIHFELHCPGLHDGGEDELALNLEIDKTHEECGNKLLLLNGSPLLPSGSRNASETEVNLLSSVDIFSGPSTQTVIAAWNRSSLDDQFSLLSVQLYHLSDQDHLHDVCGFAASFRQDVQPPFFRLKNQPAGELNNQKIHEWLRQHDMVMIDQVNCVGKNCQWLTAWVEYIRTVRDYLRDTKTWITTAFRKLLRVWSESEYSPQTFEENDVDDFYFSPEHVGIIGSDAREGIRKQSDAAVMYPSTPSVTIPTSSSATSSLATRSAEPTISSLDADEMGAFSIGSSDPGEEYLRTYLFLGLCLFGFIIVLSRLLFRCLRRRGFSCCDPRRRADWAARLEERQKRREYRKAACRHKWRKRWNRIRCLKVMHDLEEKQTVIPEHESAYQGIMHDGINHFRKAHKFVGDLLKAEEGRGGFVSYANLTRARRSRSRTNSNSDAGSSRTVDTLPQYSAPPSYDQNLPETFTVVEGFQSYTTSLPDDTPESSVVDCSPRLSFETGRSTTTREV